MVEQRNHFSNKFDDFQESKNQSLMAIQHFERLEAKMVEQAKVRVKQTKVMAEHAKVIADQAKANVEQTKTIVEE